MAYLVTALAVAIGALGMFVWFINYYNGKKLRECNPLIKSLAGFSKKSAPKDYIVDLNKVANPEGLSDVSVSDMV